MAIILRKALSDTGLDAGKLYFSTGKYYCQIIVKSLIHPEKTARYEKC